MSRTDRDRLSDILTALKRCIRFGAELDSDNDLVAEMALDAVLRNLAVAGEAVRALPEQTRELFPSAPWHSIAGLRNIVVHEYFRIDTDIIRNIVESEAAPLADDISAYFDATDDSTSEERR